MAKSLLEQYRVADFLEWFDQKRLRLNTDFQRRAVWTDDGRSYLIDTILRGLPMPKVYMRTELDVVSQSVVREIVDGQQLSLTKRAGNFAHLRYQDLEKDTQENFLSYAISVDQLVNATDEDVLEVFARLNSYTVPLNDAELRHAKYQGEFKWKIREVATSLSEYWKTFGILSTRERLRMLDDQLTAELIGIVLEGVTDGGQPSIDRLYDNNDHAFPDAENVTWRVLDGLSYLRKEFEDALNGGVFNRPPQLLILFAAVEHFRRGIPPGGLTEDFPPTGPTTEINTSLARENLALITDAVIEQSTSSRFLNFVRASSASTQRLSSRRIRFSYLWKALTESL
jgi:hypothetical protein